MATKKALVQVEIQTSRLEGELVCSYHCPFWDGDVTWSDEAGCTLFGKLKTYRDDEDRPPWGTL